MTINTAEATTSANPAALAEDVGNIVEMEHVNVTVPDQILATWFYVVGLGFTRDPYMNVTPNNIWVNVGEQEFHLPTRGPQVIPGHVGLVVPELESLKQRLSSVEAPLAGTKFAWSDKGDYVEATCPWGNIFHCYAPGAEFGDMEIGIPYVEFLVKPGAAEGIARFYREILETDASVSTDGGAPVATVSVGPGQVIRFRETSEPLPEYPGHHIAVYVANMSRSYTFLEQRGLIMEAIRGHQYRFKDIVDPETGEVVAQLEHEVRGLKHTMYGRPFVNRNPGQIQQGYHRGSDTFHPALVN